MWLAVGAFAAEPSDNTASVGIGAGVGYEFPDKFGEFGWGARCAPEIGEARTCALPAIHLSVPLRFPLSSYSSLRVSITPSFGVGEDEWSWNIGPNDRVSQRTRAFLGTLPATVGPELNIPIEGPLRPYLGGGLGLAFAGVFHSRVKQADLFGSKYTACDLVQTTAALDDCAAEPNGALSPYVLQPAFAGDLFLGVQTGSIWLELAYSLQYLPKHRLVGALEGETYDVKREPINWNGLFFSVGISP